MAVDLTRANLESATSLGNTPTALVYGFGSLWAADPIGEQVLRIDERSGEVIDRISVGAQPSALSVGGGALWVASAVGGLVTRIDPKTARATQTQRLGGANPSALLFVRGSLWVADQTDHSVVRIDPATGSIRQSITLDLAPSALAYADGELWAAGYEAAAVDQIDLASGQVVAKLSVGQGPSAIAAYGRIRLGDQQPRRHAHPDRRGDRANASGDPRRQRAIGARCSERDSSGLRVSIPEPRPGRCQARARSRRVNAGGRPSTLATTSRRLWVGSGPSVNRHRGGTLRLSGTVRPNSLDPAFELVGSWVAAQLPRLVYDSLVTFDNSPGPDGLGLSRISRLQLPAPPITARLMSSTSGRGSDTRRAAPQAADFPRAIRAALPRALARLVADSASNRRRLSLHATAARLRSLPRRPCQRSCSHSRSFI